MKFLSTMEIIKQIFRLEIKNELIFKRNEIIVILSDGTKAKIILKKAVWNCVGGKKWIIMY